MREIKYINVCTHTSARISACVKFFKENLQHPFHNSNEDASEMNNLQINLNNFSKFLCCPTALTLWNLA